MSSKLRKIHPDEFDEVYAIMQSSFPADEMRDYQGQKDLLRNSKYSIFVVSDEEIKAFITTWEFDDFIFVEHFAVNEKYRNLGLGSLMLNELCRNTDKQICLEVELPETEKAKRRIGFYERNGFVLNSYQYEQPAYSEEKQPVPLIIMTSGSAIDEKRFYEMKKAIFKQVYNK